MDDPLIRYARTHPRAAASRRAVLGSLGLAVGFAAAPAFAAPKLPAAPPLPPAVPERAGALSWTVLAGAIGPSGAVRVTPAIVALDGRAVEIDGWMMPGDDDERPTRFLLTRFDAHCPFCMPGGVASLVEVASPAGVALVEDRPVSLAGVLRVDSRRDARLIYRLVDARGA